MTGSGTAASLDLPFDKYAPRAARRFVAGYSRSLPGELADDAALLVSELVTNAVRHGGPELTVRVHVEPTALGVAVQDHGTAAPSPRTGPPDASSPTGRGLLLVDSVSSEWGVTPSDPPPGKTVWFRLARPAA
jgi:anti-sigma regulatory factor (Ser/Thr protein kinase)